MGDASEPEEERPGPGKSEASIHVLALVLLKNCQASGEYCDQRLTAPSHWVAASSAQATSWGGWPQASGTGEMRREPSILRHLMLDRIKLGCLGSGNQLSHSGIS